MKYTKTTTIEIEITDEFINEYKDDHDDMEITIEDIKDCLDDMDDDDMEYCLYIENSLNFIKEEITSKIEK